MNRSFPAGELGAATYSTSPRSDALSDIAPFAATCTVPPSSAPSMTNGHVFGEQAPPLVHAAPAPVHEACAVTLHPPPTQHAPLGGGGGGGQAAVQSPPAVNVPPLDAHDESLATVHTPLAEQHRPMTGGAATTVICQSAPLLLSHVPEPLLNTQSICVALLGTRNVCCHGPAPPGRVIAGSGEGTLVQPLIPRWI